MCSWYKERYRCSSYIINYPNHKYGWYNLKNPCYSYTFFSVCKNEHFRHILLFHFGKGKNAAQASKKLRYVYGEEALKDKQCRNWFDKFRFGDFSLKDEQRLGRPNEVDDDQIKAINESDRHVTVREIEEILKNQQSTFVYSILDSLKNLIFEFHMNWKKVI